MKNEMYDTYLLLVELFRYVVHFVMLFMCCCNLRKGLILKICTLCFVIINIVLLNPLCV